MICRKCRAENPGTARFCADCGTPLPPGRDHVPDVTETYQTPVHELTTGATFAGRYQVIEELGHGGMGRVYKVFDTRIKEKIALKVLRPEIAPDKDTAERFSNELKLARRISHRNVCRMFDLGKDEGTTFITMEFVPGEDLKKFIRKSGQIGAGRAVAIARQVCEGLAEAHRLGVVHRDLKPQNVMVDEDGNARIMDFGIARSLQGKGITGAGVMIGTPEYMSPEQVEGKNVDPRSDIYSLGIILYEMLTGRVPFEGDTPFTIGVKHKSEAPKDPRALNAQIPEDLSRLIMKCLEKDRTGRYPTAAALGADLERLEQGLPTTERVVSKRKPFTSREITVKFRLRKAVVPALVFVVLGVLALAVWKLAPRRSPASDPAGQPSVAVLYFKNNTGDPKFDIWSTALSDSIVTDLSRSKFMRVLSTDQVLSVLKKLGLLDARSYASEDLRKVADLGGVKHVLLGSMSKAGGVFRIDYALQDVVQGEIVTSDRVEGAGEDSIFAMVDELTRKVKGNLRLTDEQIAADSDVFAQATTKSPRAYAYMTEAYRYNYVGEFQKSVDLLEQAVALDPGFATAYYMLAHSYTNLGVPSKNSEFMRKAFELSGDLPDRERYLIESGYYQSTEVTYDKAIAAYQKRLELEPNEINAERNLAVLYLRLERWDTALALLKGNIEAGVEAVFPYTNAAWAYSGLGLYDKARGILEEYRRSHGDMSFVCARMALVHLVEGQYDRAMEEADKAFTLDPAAFGNRLDKGDIQLLAGNSAEAHKEYRQVLGLPSKSAQLNGRAVLADWHVDRGQFDRAVQEANAGLALAVELEDKGMMSALLKSSAYARLRAGQAKEALSELDRARDIDVERGSVRGRISSRHLKGLALLEAGSIGDARAEAEEVRALVDGWLNEKLARYYDHLLGTIALREGDYPKAVEHLDRAVSLLNHQSGKGDDTHALFYEPLALACFESGDLDKAREQYETITSLTTGRLGFGDIYARSFYMLGRIAEQTADRARAREHYRRFLDLWSDADADLPEVADAKARLAALGK